MIAAWDRVLIGEAENEIKGAGDDTDSGSLKQKWPLLISLLALLIGLVGVCVLSAVYGLSGGIYPDDHGIVMDAGSTKTNVIEYHWPGEKTKNTGYVVQGKTCFAQGGIAKMNPMNLTKVTECAKNVTLSLDEDVRSKTPLYFAATAGMRLLNLSNPEKVAELLEQLSVHLPETKLTIKAIEIISGRDEGIYAWITVNYLAKTLETQQKVNPWIPTTQGALDMGGASMQIAYTLPDGPSNASSDEMKTIELYGQNHNVFSRSNLCFGREEATRRFRALLIDGQKITAVVDPCLPKGYSETETGKNLFSQPCTNSPKFDDWISKDPDILDRIYTFSGSSDYKTCEEKVSKLLDNDLCSTMEFKECFKKLDGQSKDQKYMAFATYWFTTDFLNLTKKSLEEYEAGTKDYCVKYIEEINNITKNKFRTQYCFNAQYIHEVLINGFGFNNETWLNVEFIGQIEDNDVGWTMGYMIHATNFLPKTNPSGKVMTPAAVTVLLVLLIVLTIASTVFLVHTKCGGKRRDQTRSTESHYGAA